MDKSYGLFSNGLLLPLFLVIHFFLLWLTPDLLGLKLTSLLILQNCLGDRGFLCY